MNIPESHLWNFFFFFNDTATTEIYTLSLHDALPISLLGDKKGRPLKGRPFGTEGTGELVNLVHAAHAAGAGGPGAGGMGGDRKSTRLNSSHLVISYAVFCLKKKIKDTSYDELLTSV